MSRKEGGKKPQIPHSLFHYEFLIYSIGQLHLYSFLRKTESLRQATIMARILSLILLQYDSSIVKGEWIPNATGSACYI